MTNNENKIDKEKAIELIAGRIDDEFKKHPQLNWQKIAASKIHSQWFEQSQSALEEKDETIQRMAQRMQEIDRGYCKKIEGLQSQLSLKDTRIKELEEGIEFAFNESRLTHPMVGFKHNTFEDFKNHFTLLSPSKEQ